MEFSASFIGLPMALYANYAFSNFEKRQDENYLKLALIKDYNKALERKKTPNLSITYGKLRARNLDVVIAIVRTALFLGITHRWCQTKYLKDSFLSKYSPVFFTPFVINQLLVKFMYFCQFEFYRNHMGFLGLGDRQIYICTGREEGCAFCRRLFQQKVAKGKDIENYYAYGGLERRVKKMLKGYYLLFSIYVCSILVRFMLHSFKAPLTK